MEPEKDMASTGISPNWVRVLTITVLLLTLALSPLVTLALFHPGSTGFVWPEKFEYFLDLQMCQIEPLLVSFALLSVAIFRDGQSDSWGRVCIIIIGHLIIAFLLISVRSEGGLRWWD